MRRPSQNHPWSINSPPWSRNSSLCIRAPTPRMSRDLFSPVQRFYQSTLAAARSGTPGPASSTCPSAPGKLPRSSPASGSVLRMRQPGACRATPSQKTSPAVPLPSAPRLSPPCARPLVRSNIGARPGAWRLRRTPAGRTPSTAAGRPPRL